MSETKNRSNAADARFKSIPEAQSLKLSAFIRGIFATRFFQPDGNPSEGWKLFRAESWKTAAGTSWSAARSTKNGLGVDSVRELAIEAAKAAVRGTPRRAGLPAVFAECEQAIIDAPSVKSAYKDACADSCLDLNTIAYADSDAKKDAELVAVLIVAEDLEFPGKKQYAEYAARRWEVWQKGYAAQCDVDGILYVYAKEPARKADARSLARKAGR